MALKRLNQALALQPDLAEALFDRAFCYRRLRKKPAAASDLFRYLREFGSRVPDYRESLDCKPSEVERILRTIHTLQQKNETALLELLSISLKDFLSGLDLPTLSIPVGSSHKPEWLLSEVFRRLVQWQRWEDAVGYLEDPKVMHLIETWKGGDWKRFRAFCLAVAYWGRDGTPSRALSLQALEAGKPSMEGNADDLDPAFFQEVSLLYWMVGDVSRAAEALDHALTRLDETDGKIMAGISSWTFGETTPREFRSDCEQQRRMIRGEPIRPAFLGPQR
jgi:tetratricopeptide (TPR) repeat protein